MHTLVLRIFFPSTWALHQASRSQHDPLTSPTSPSSRRRRRNSSNSSSSEDDNLFPAAAGEAMVGFDIPNGAPPGLEDPRDAQRRRRENMERFAGRNMAYARAMGFSAGENDAQEATNNRPSLFSGPPRMTTQNDQLAPERRLSRELEAGFRDDSDDEDDEDHDRGVTVGRRSISRTR